MTGLTEEFIVIFLIKITEMTMKVMTFQTKIITEAIEMDAMITMIII